MAPKILIDIFKFPPPFGRQSFYDDTYSTSLKYSTIIHSSSKPFGYEYDVCDANGVYVYQELSNYIHTRWYSIITNPDLNGGLAKWIC